MVEQVAALEAATAALMDIYEYGTEQGKVAGYKQNVRAYRHAIQAVLRGKVGYTVDEQKEKFAEAVSLANEAVAFIDERDYDAHQAAKQIAKDAYEAAYVAYVEAGLAEAEAVQ